jgi:hypothetical protein
MGSRVQDIHPAAKYGNCFPPGLDAACMGMSVNSHSQSTDNNNPGPGKLTGQHGTDSPAIVSGGTGTDNCDRWSVQTVDFSPQIEENRRVMDRTEKGGKQEIIGTEDINILCTNTFILLIRPPAGLIDPALISKNSPQPPTGSFHFGYGFTSGKDCCGRTKYSKQPMDQRTADTGQGNQSQPVFDIIAHIPAILRTNAANQS